MIVHPADQLAATAIIRQILYTIELMKYPRPLILFALLGLLNWPVSAWSGSDTVYISDMLRVGVRPEPDTRSTPVGVITTGMKLDVLDRQDGYLQIRTEKGLVGWIREIYAVEKPPAMIQLASLHSEQGRMQEELEALRQNVETLQDANSTLNSQLDIVKAERSKLQLRLARSTTEQGDTGGQWVFWLPGLFLTALAAFIGGVLWQRSQTARRLGGLRF